MTVLGLVGMTTDMSAATRTSQVIPANAGIQTRSIFTQGSVLRRRSLLPSANGLYRLFVYLVALQQFQGAGNRERKGVVGKAEQLIV